MPVHTIHNSVDKTCGMPWNHTWHWQGPRLKWHERIKIGQEMYLRLSFFVLKSHNISSSYAGKCATGMTPMEWT